MWVTSCGVQPFTSRSSVNFSQAVASSQLLQHEPQGCSSCHETQSHVGFLWATVSARSLLLCGLSTAQMHLLQRGVLHRLQRGYLMHCAPPRAARGQPAPAPGAPPLLLHWPWRLQGCLILSLLSQLLQSGTAVFWFDFLKPLNITEAQAESPISSSLATGGGPLSMQVGTSSNHNGAAPELFSKIPPLQPPATKTLPQTEYNIKMQNLKLRLRVSV